MIRRLAVAIGVAVAVSAAGVGLAPGVGAAAPSPQPGVVVTGVQATPGRVEFFLAGRQLPGGVPLDRATITVRAGDTELATSVRTVATSGAEVPRRGVVLVIDASGSMAGERLAAARTAAADYAAAAPAGVSLGLVAVGDTPVTLVRPTEDRAAFRAAAAGIKVIGKTALYDGIIAGLDLLDPKRNPAAQAYVERRIVVLSDGADTASTVDFGELGERLAKAKATMDAVAFGEADRVELTTLTGITGGRAVPAADAGALRDAFRAMAAQLSAPVVVSATVPVQLSAKAVTLSVEVAARGEKATASVPVQLRPDPAAAAPPAKFRSTPVRPIGLYVALGALGAALFLVVLLIVLPLLGRSDVRRRLGQLDRFSLGRRASVVLPPTGGPAPGGMMLKAALSVSERSVQRPGRKERIELALDRAGSNLRAAEWELIRTGMAAAAALLLALPLPWWAGLPLGLLAGWFGAGFYLRWRAGRRTRRFADQLPDALQLVVGSLRSGFSLPQSIDALVREGEDPVASELGRALAETRLGGDLEDSLERVGERNASQDMAWLVMAIRIQREVGGNLSETLETAVATMRERGRLVRHVRALSAEGRLSALVLLGMPIVLGGWMFVFRRDYLRPLYTEPLGLMMLVGSVVMVVVGALWLRKLVKVEV